MIPESTIWAIVPAAGSGVRMQAALPKQYLSLCGRPVIQHTLERLCAHPRIRGVLVGLSAQDREWPRLVSGLARLEKLKGSFIGGATRAETVLNGLQALSADAQPQDWVLVHDAARPCLHGEDIDRLLEAGAAHADGALLALPVSDTVKRTDESQLVVETVSRTNLWRAVTPQLFRHDRLQQSLRRALAGGVNVTDEASAVEADGGRPRVVAGRADNIKITVAEDLALAELFLRRQEQS